MSGRGSARRPSRVGRVALALTAALLVAVWPAASAGAQGSAAQGSDDLVVRRVSPAFDQQVVLVVHGSSPLRQGAGQDVLVSQNGVALQVQDRPLVNAEHPLGIVVQVGQEQLYDAQSLVSEVLRAVPADVSVRLAPLSDPSGRAVFAPAALTHLQNLVAAPTSAELDAASGRVTATTGAAASGLLVVTSCPQGHLPQTRSDVTTWVLGWGPACAADSSSAGADVTAVRAPDVQSAVGRLDTVLASLTGARRVEVTAVDNLDLDVSWGGRHATVALGAEPAAVAAVGASLGDLGSQGPGTPGPGWPVLAAAVTLLTVVLAVLVGRSATGRRPARVPVPVASASRPVARPTQLGASGPPGKSARKPLPRPLPSSPREPLPRSLPPSVPPRPPKVVRATPSPADLPARPPAAPTAGRPRAAGPEPGRGPARPAARDRLVKQRPAALSREGASSGEGPSSGEAAAGKGAASGETEAPSTSGSRPMSATGSQRWKKGRGGKPAAPLRKPRSASPTIDLRPFDEAADSEAADSDATDSEATDRSDRR